MKPDEFESSLQRQELRKIPADWRNAILRTAVANSTAAVPRLSTPAPRRLPWWRELLWPCPQVWAGLAAAWVLIALMNFQSGERSARDLAKKPLPSKELLLALREQRRVLERVLETDEPSTAPAKHFVPRPRSEKFRPTAIG